MDDFSESRTGGPSASDDGAGGAMSDAGAQRALMGARSIAQDIVDEWKGVSLEFEGEGVGGVGMMPTTPSAAAAAGLVLSRPFAVAFAFEARAATTVVRCMVDQVLALLAGIKGSVPLTDDMRSMAGCLSARTVPPVWQHLLSVAPQDERSASLAVEAFNAVQGGLPPSSSASLPAWLQRLALSWRQLQEWMDEYGGSTGGVPPVVWAGGLMRPELMLTAVQRQAVQYLGCSLEQVSVESRMLSSTADEHVDPPSRGLVLSGLVCRGCCWTTGKSEGSVHHGSIASADSSAVASTSRDGDGRGGEEEEAGGPVNGGTALPLLHLTGGSKTVGTSAAPSVGRGGAFAPMPLVRVDPSAGKASVLATLRLPVAVEPGKLALAGAVVEIS